MVTELARVDESAKSGPKSVPIASWTIVESPKIWESSRREITHLERDLQVIENHCRTHMAWVCWSLPTVLCVVTRTHSTIVQIIIEGIANSEAERSGYIGIHGNTWTADARGHRFEYWTCQIIFLSVMGTFL